MYPICLHLNRDVLILYSLGIFAVSRLIPQQMRFIEILIDQLTARVVTDAAALYEAPFNDIHSGGPDALFAGKDTVISGVFDVLQQLERLLLAAR